ncbi:hypothetical protein [Kordiimonas marina]|uniref:hypothetical protein n=1 Tax=Kordiimonas marina TaxID=2872312 RepID=UPI001FF140B5|nr:hypothetical protein [Kordiimonas marina]MCJ9428569.1 hypothetical protein [Kordiimonas marina]
MPALNFQKRFAPLVESGAKPQTIRAWRKDGRDVKQGDRLFLYTGMRTKACRKLGESICTGTSPVIIHEDGMVLGGMLLPNHTPILNSIANRDGFVSWSEMHTWFRQEHGPIFGGQLIEWGPLQ